MQKDLWYRKFLMLSIILGLVGGFGAVVFSLVTNSGIEFLFGEISKDNWSGNLYWIPLTSLGAIIVTYLRKKYRIPKNVPSAIELAEASWVDTKTALPLLLIAVISIVFGASLGPSFGIILIGGAFATWFVKKIEPRLKRTDQGEYVKSGMAGSLGAVFGAPILAVILSKEVAPSTRDYMKSVLPLLISTSFGYLVFFGILSATIINSYALPQYSYRNVDLFIGSLLGIGALIALLIFKILSSLTGKFMQLIRHDYARAIIGGALVGLTTIAVPLTFGSGNQQLVTVTSDFATFTIVGLIIILSLKVIAIKISLDSGFIGGTVFPVMFYSGTFGVLIHILFPSIPIALTVSAMMATIPGAVLSAPISLILIAVSSTGQGSAIIPPITIAVTVTQVGMYLIKKRQNNIKSAKKKIN